MVALTQDKKTIQRDGVNFNDPVGAGVQIFAGALVVLNATGYLVPATTATGLARPTVAQENVDNSAGADGDVSCESKKAPYHFANDGSIDRTHIGGTAYIVDDQTVAATDGAGTRSAAGEIIDVDADGVFVDL